MVNDAALLQTPIDNPRKRWGLYALGAAIAIAAGLLFWPKSLTDWDSWEYAYLAITSQPSGLCLRRWWFIFLMQMAYLLGGGSNLDASNAFAPMKVAVLIMSAGSVVVVMHWTWLITRRLTATALAGLIAIASPALLLYCGTVMTEGPTLLMLGIMWVAWEKAIAPSGRSTRGAIILAAISGWCFGMAISMREPAMFLCVWPIVSCFVDKPKKRWTLLGTAIFATAASLGLAVIMAWVWSGVDPMTAMKSYSDYMTKERAIYGFNGLRNIMYLFTHLFAAVPLAGFVFTGWAVMGIFMRKHMKYCVSPQVIRRLKFLGLSALPYIFMTWYNPNLSFNYRLMLPLGWLLIPIAAVGFESLGGMLLRIVHCPARLRIYAGTLTALGFTAIVMCSAYSSFMIHAVAYNDMQDELFRSMCKLPNKDVYIVPGPASATGLYMLRSGGRSSWVVRTTEITTFDWKDPDVLRREFARELAAGRRVFVNLDERGWKRPDNEPFEWNTLNAAAGSYQQ
ncbi:MAG: hypothetical protein KAR11_06805, partial [Phycisphaerae bacterium]|nr:hypothetical protein [Phycisphaerae bacterium]